MHCLVILQLFLLLYGLSMAVFYLNNQRQNNVFFCMDPNLEVGHFHEIGSNIQQQIKTSSSPSLKSKLLYYAVKE